MSKTAIAALKKAENIIKTAGITVDLVGYLNDGKSRTVNGKKLWRNADKLAALIIDSAANAFQTENSTTFEENMMANMEQAVDRYISSNLDCWSQVELEGCHSFFKVDQLARLAEMVAQNVAFENKENDHSEALAVNRRVNELLDIEVPIKFSVECAFEWQQEHDEAHAEALELYEIECAKQADFVDTSIFQGVCQFTVKGREFRLEGADLSIREKGRDSFVLACCITLPKGTAKTPLNIYQAYVDLNY